MLEIDISKNQGDFRLLCDLHISTGITAIYGPSGSGKTTLLNCVAGFSTPDSGKIMMSNQLFFSKEKKVNVPVEKRRLGYVLQESGLFPHLTVHKNIKYGYELTPDNIKKYDLDYLIEMLAIEPLLERDVSSLSGGERQRVALVRSLATSPQLLLLDEPMASIDARFRGFLIYQLKKMSLEIGIPMLYVSHSLSEVMVLANNAIVMNKGAVIAEGEPNILFTTPEVTGLTDFSSYENLVEASVLESDQTANMTTVSLGDHFFYLPFHDLQVGQKVFLSVRASDAILSIAPLSGTSARNIVEARITSIYVADKVVLIECYFGVKIFVEITHQSYEELGLVQGSSIYVVIKANAITLLDA
tara:strand:- start:3304 stop:4377 length:1074 start_codon:yes stop_codon:yes gene_type:complete